MFTICNISCIIRGPSCRRVVIVLIRLFYERLHSVVLLRLPFIFRLPEKRPSVSFWCNRWWMLYWFNYPKCLFTRCWPWRGFSLYFVIVNQVAPRRCGCLWYLILIFRNRTVPSRLDVSINKKKTKNLVRVFRWGRRKVFVIPLFIALFFCRFVTAIIVAC